MDWGILLRHFPFSLSIYIVMRRLKEVLLYLCLHVIFLSVGKKAAILGTCQDSKNGLLSEYTEPFFETFAEWKKVVKSIL